MSTMFNSVPQFKCPVYDLDGNPLVGGKIYCYQSSNKTLTAAYTSDVGDVEHSNPIILDEGGKSGDVYLPAGVAFNFVVKSSSGETFATFNNFYGVDETPVNPEA